MGLQAKSLGFRVYGVGAWIWGVCRLWLRGWGLGQGVGVRLEVSRMTKNPELARLPWVYQKNKEKPSNNSNNKICGMCQFMSLL